MSTIVTASTPRFSEDVRVKIGNALCGSLSNKERVCLLKEISVISIKYYNVVPNQYVAIQLVDGKIVECAETELGLLKSMQGKTFPSPIFICKS